MKARLSRKSAVLRHESEPKAGETYTVADKRLGVYCLIFFKGKNYE